MSITPELHGVLSMKLTRDVMFGVHSTGVISFGDASAWELRGEFSGDQFLCFLINKSNMSAKASYTFAVVGETSRTVAQIVTGTLRTKTFSMEERDGLEPLCTKANMTLYTACTVKCTMVISNPSFVKATWLQSGYLCYNRRWQTATDTAGFTDALPTDVVLNSPWDVAHALDRSTWTATAANKSVLSLASPVFRAMFLSDMVEGISNEVDIPDFPTAVVQQLVTFCGTDRCELAAMQAHGDVLLQAAHKYQISPLQALCEEYLCSILSDDNCSQLLALACLCSAGQLRRRATNYIVYNIQRLSVREDFLVGLRAEDCTELVRAFANAVGGEYAPRQVEYHPTRKCLAFGTTAGELCMLSFNDQGIADSQPKSAGMFGKHRLDNLLALCWLKPRGDSDKDNLLLTGSNAGRICLLDTAKDGSRTRNVVREYAYETDLSSIHINSTNELMLVCGASNPVKVIDVETAQVVHRYENIHSDGINISRFCNLVPHLFATSSYDGSVKTWDLRQSSRKTPIYSVQYDTGVAMIAFSPDDSMVAVSTLDSEMHQFLFRSGRRHMTYSFPAAENRFRRGYFTQSGRHLLSGGEASSTVSIACAYTGEVVSAVDMDFVSAREAVRIQTLRPCPMTEDQFCVITYTNSARQLIVATRRPEAGALDSLLPIPPTVPPAGRSIQSAVPTMQHSPPAQDDTVQLTDLEKNCDVHIAEVQYAAHCKDTMHRMEAVQAQLDAAKQAREDFVQIATLGEALNGIHAEVTNLRFPSEEALARLAIKQADLLRSVEARCDTLVKSRDYAQLKRLGEKLNLLKEAGQVVLVNDCDNDPVWVGSVGVNAGAKA